MPSNVGRAFAADRRHKIPVVVVLDPRALTYVREFPGHGASVSEESARTQPARWRRR
jgi:hypothetical protein